MTVELLHDRATVIAHADLDGLLPTIASVVLRRADGTTLQSPVVTVPTTATTIAVSGSTVDALVVVSAAGLRVGEPVAVVSDGETYVTTPARIDGNTLHLLSALPVVPDAGSPVRALRMSATVTALTTAELGSGLQLEWRYNSATADGFATYEVAVVRWLWQAPITAAEVAELLATVYQTTRSDEFCRSVAERVSTKIRNAIEQTGRRPHLYAAPGAFAEVAQAATRWVLADTGIGIVGDLASLVRAYRFEFTDEMAKVVAGLTAYDVLNQGRTDAPRRNVVAIRTRR